ncbi:hypothetical protein GCM10007382_15130 [Salinibacterium xinjiangense]|uniref:Uncharacterized protein n=2 Tax=Salinibacterium xinjiangense TaxID=386302 RepID=A0A2C8Y8V3_9MICO|nr:hypothetical protein GCM10007382_15130 [Salinibacterium xinjiangense]SOE46561.1 hypothetical protein SAMN06296378_0160 [Salinibacterium xinjiangense]
MMSSIRIAVVAGVSAVAAIAVVAALVVGFSNGPTPGGGAAGAAAPVAKTEFPGLTAPTGDPQLLSIARLAPDAGTVQLAEGPFDDRFEVNDLAFDGATVSGSILVTSDVSEVINLEVLAGFYDSAGALIGEGRFVLESEHGTTDDASKIPDETVAFRIDVPAAIAGQASSAAVGVPVLVNE